VPPEVIFAGKLRHEKTIPAIKGRFGPMHHFAWLLAAA
jgi:hypothetical protein